MTTETGLPATLEPAAILAGARAFYRTQREVHDDIDMPDWKDVNYHEVCAAIHVSILVLGAAHGYHWPDTSEGRINELLAWDNGS